MTQPVEHGLAAPTTMIVHGEVRNFEEFAEDDAVLLEGIVAALRTVNDPEIPVNIYDLGLIYRIEVKEDGGVEIDMTLTAPGCPVAGQMLGWVQEAVVVVPGVSDVKMKLVFDPPWDKSRMSDEVQLELGLL
ncbi:MULTISPECIES: iron-sulfur cluster assembly protein [Xanthobacter]|jgi:FeS assembly SUF system protein|uniref:Iron-sulfur cluster assembly protein n=1 Tax=Xanthobacter aminoxidans TaxID=186280 RepID=A0ABW6ZRQ7_9HYPH|nr:MULTISPECIES: iron-sulfur cluster assembly protein [Xanthobacter]MCL8385627.1 iron-sulfur cluster assembly protein [Xanthobacter aminoxidans]